MPERIEITAPARLHFGLFSIGDVTERKFGGAGLMIQAPSTVVTATRSKAFQVTGLAQDAVVRNLQKWLDGSQILIPGKKISRVESLPIAIHVDSMPPRHSGFGTGTQLALATATAVIRLLDLPTPSPIELASSVGRGKRSAIGTYGFHQGGFLVDRGKTSLDALSPLDFHTQFPEDWSIVTVIPPQRPGLFGNSELDAFRELPSTPIADRQQTIELVREKIIPGVMQQDYRLFGDGVYEFGYRSGMMFTKIQNGPYNGDQVQSLVNQIREFGVPAVGQSSWGPCVYAITPDHDTAVRLSEFLTSRWQDSCQIAITKADNVGARGTTNRHEVS